MSVCLHGAFFLFLFDLNVISSFFSAASQPAAASFHSVNLVMGNVSVPRIIIDIQCLLLFCSYLCKYYTTWLSLSIYKTTYHSIIASAAACHLLLENIFWLHVTPFVGNQLVFSSNAVAIFPGRRSERRTIYTNHLYTSFYFIRCFLPLAALL